MARSLLAVFVLGALLSCKSGIGKSNDLSFGQVQAIQTGITAAQVLDAFGAPMRTDRGPDGKVTRMLYPALDAKQSREHLDLEFDANEVLVRKTFSGKVVKP